MRKTLFIFVFILLILTGCGQKTTEPTQMPAVTETMPAPTKIPSEAPTELPTEPPAEAPTLPPHSEFYIPGLSVEDVILYFNEVCLDAEITHSGDPSVLQKWISPVSFLISGDPTAEDLETLNNFAQWLNTIDGFPGIVETEDPAFANLRIYFCSEQELIDLMGDNFYGMDGAVTFWYADNIIYDAIICYRTDLEQALRNSVILEEIYNGLGPIQDTDLRLDSIIYSGFTQPQELTEIDRLILKLLYHPDLKCGMDADACETLIRQLYY